MLKHEEEMSARDTEVALLKARLLTLEGCGQSSTCSNTGTVQAGDVQSMERGSRIQLRRGKAPPVGPFNGDKADQLWEDWFPTLERAAAWYDWEEEEKLLQLAGHLRCKAQRE